MAEEFLEFHEMPRTSKTKVIGIYSKRHGDHLGMIRWFGRWRQYVFFPVEDTAWNPACLEMVNAKIRDLMQERRRERSAVGGLDWSENTKVTR